MDFKSQVKTAHSSMAKLIFVKVPDALNDLSVNNTRNEITGTIANPDGSERWFSPKIPDQFCQFVGYSHQLTDEQN